MTNFSAIGDSIPPADHQYFSELCALATTGTLTEAEWTDLKAHIASCLDCFRSMQEYREIARTGMSLLVPDRSEERPEVNESWSPETAKRDLFQRIARGDEIVRYGRRAVIESESLGATIRRWLLKPRVPPAYWYSAAAIIIATLVASSYQLGTKRGLEHADAQVQSAMSEGSVLRQQLNELTHERGSLQDSLTSGSAQLQSLHVRLERLSTELENWKALQARTVHDAQHEASTASALQSALSSTIAERDAATRKLRETQAEFQQVQTRYETLRQLHSAELLRATSLESQIVDLSARLKDVEANVKEHEQFLASDRDIRELMGARQLYIADVFDVDSNGEKRRPFGRVFYTTGKSLIFYAFDLAQQPQLRNAGTFQAWGRRGVGDKRPLSLGIFYLDNVANRRWVLKFDNPVALAQIDAVFVTVEPHRGSQIPSGKQLLFASLRTPPNHP